MSFTRTTLCWLLALMPCLANKCEDDNPPPCDSQYAGGLGLLPSSAQWLPTPDSLRFVNSQGYRLVLDRTLLAAPTDSLPLPALVYEFRIQEVLRPNNPYVTCRHYFRAAQIAARYRGRSLNLNLAFNLFKNTGAGVPLEYNTPLTQAAADTLSDLLVLTFNQYEIPFSLPRQPSRLPNFALPGAATYRDSVQLAGRTLRGVYQVSQGIYADAVQPQHFFFQPGQGLVGFIYSNREQWVRF